MDRDRVVSCLIWVCMIGLFVSGPLWGSENNVVAIIGFCYFSLSVTVLTIYSLGQDLGVIGVICGILISASSICLMLWFLMGRMSWLPYSEKAYGILFWIGMPLIIGSGGTAGVTKLIMVFWL